MKSILLLSFTFIVFCAYSQKKLTAIEYRKYDAALNIQQHDSNALYYNDWKGSLNEFEPTIELFDFNYDFIPHAELIAYDASFYYEFTNNTPFLNGTSFQAFTNGLLTEQGNNNFKYEFFYDGNGNQIQTNTLISYGPGVTWVQVAELTQTFDQFGNILVRTSFDENGQIQTVDSMTYVPSSFDLLSQIRYQYNINTNTIEPSVKNEMTYQGSKIDRIDYFYSDGAGGLDFNRRYKYFFSGNTLVKLKSSLVNNGTLDTSEYIEKTFQYNSMNQLIESNTTYTGDTSHYSSTYEYDSDGFLIKRSSFYGFTTIPNSLELRQEWRYAFLTTANIDKLNSTKVTIYPNPASKIIKIQTDSPLKIVQLLNLSGQLLIEQNSDEINLEHLPNGTYLIQGATEKSSFSEQIIKR